MPAPRTRDEMIGAGYKFSNHAKCRSCHEEIEWWTTVNGKKSPYNLMPTGNSHPKSHFATCEFADAHRRK
jgi:hypothetical protein